MASFLAETELIYPDARDPERPEGRRRDKRPGVRTGLAAPPQSGRLSAGLAGPPRARPPPRGQPGRARGVDAILALQRRPDLERPRPPVFDLRAAALVETDQPESLRGYLARTPVDPSESVSVVSHEPQRVELSAVLNHPGLVILADTYYPGWRLTIDGTPAPIFRANRLMRGAAVPAGKHTLVYTFEPLSFRIGAVISIAGALVLSGPRGRPRAAVSRRRLNSCWRR